MNCILLERDKKQGPNPFRLHASFPMGREVPAAQANQGAVSGSTFAVEHLLLIALKISH